MVDIKLTQKKVESLIDLVNRRYPNWQGFSDQRFIDDELTYKENAVETAQKLLEKKALKQLIAGQEYDVIHKRIEEVAQSGKNLLYLAAPSSGDLAVVYDETLDKPSFYQAFYDLLYGTDTSPERVEHFSTYLESHGLPNKWTFATYFLYLLSPETEMFVKPTTKSWFMKFCGAQKSLPSRPNHDDYKLILDLCHQLKDDLSTYNPTNLIDIQGFISGKNVESKACYIEQRIEEFQSLYEEFLDDFLYTEKGNEHIRYILEGRNLQKRISDVINQARCYNGDDITDLVLLNDFRIQIQKIIA